MALLTRLSVGTNPQTNPFVYGKMLGVIQTTRLFPLRRRLFAFLLATIDDGVRAGEKDGDCVLCR